MFEKTKDVTIGTAKVAAKIAIPGAAGAFAGKEKYDECKSNGEGSMVTTAKVTGTAIWEQTKYSVGGALLGASFSG